ncbi:MAG TPA: EamA family transporter [Bacteroidales bacterium]|nr:EamA family transporter [Bacteroidales bacterium]
MKNKLWLVYALITTLFWGVWGALTEVSEKGGFPGTLIYIVWAFTMIIPALIGLKIIHWKVEKDFKSILLGCTIGLLGAGGQLALFTGAIVNGPAYLIFPIISLSPVITILLSVFILKEKASRVGWAGIILAVSAIPLLSYQDPDTPSIGYLWLVFALVVFIAWGMQAFFMKLANNTMKAESIFFYMTITGLLLSPIAWLMTDHSQAIDWGTRGVTTAFGIQLLNSIGALTIVYAFRYGKAIVVSPLTNAVAPIITILLSLLIYAVIPHPFVLIGMVLAVISIFLLAKE